MDEQTVAVGVMAYYGTNDERSQAEEIYARYVDAMKQFVRWLVDNGRKVLLIVGDTNGSDGDVVQEILADVRANRPDLDPSVVTAPARHVVLRRPAGTAAGQQRGRDPVSQRPGRACRLSKPTIAISYSPKHDVLVAEMGLPEFCLAVNALDVGELIKLFTELESRSAELRQTLIEHNAEKTRLIGDLFAELSAVLFGSAEPSPAADGARARCLSEPS